jgi:C1A family cysteine protease
MKRAISHAAVVLACALAGAHASFIDPEVVRRFAVWQQSFNVTIPVPEYDMRLAQFASNVDLIEAENARARAAGETLRLGINRFSHLSVEEFQSTYLLPLAREAPHPTKIAAQPRPVQPALALPAAVNWEDKGAVSPVRFQGKCAACWAFSASGAVEGARAIKTGNLTALSPQQIVECDHSTWHGKKVDNGCRGTWYGLDSAFAWIQANGGLCAFDAYPYTGVNSTDWTTCHQRTLGCANIANSAPVAHTDVTPATEEALLAAVARQPVSVVMDFSCAGLMHYHSGVWTKDCGTKLDHALLVVGYGVDEPSGKKFWRVKNSFGTGWGEKGFIRMERGLAQTQGGHGISDIASTASYPKM